MASGDTKTQNYLDIAANGARDDLPADSCCNTRTQSLILGIAERVMNVEDEVEELKNNPDVVDIVDTYADLQAYDTQHLTNNDIVRVLQDETHDGNSTYYRFTKNPDTWTFIGEIAGGVNVVQTTGTSTTDVMSQNATTSMVFADPRTLKRIRIGSDSVSGTNGCISVGPGAHTGGSESVGIGANAYGVANSRTCALGSNSYCAGENGVALGAYSRATDKGQVDISTGARTTEGYNSSGYRLLTGVHDPVSAHDAATKGYVDANAGGAAKVLTTNDYNYDKGNTGTNNCVAMWLLPPGLYSNSNGVNTIVASNYSFDTHNRTYLVSKSDSVNDDDVQIMCFRGKTLADRAIHTVNSYGTGINSKYFLVNTDTVNNLNSSDTVLPLSANQGKILSNKIDAISSYSETEVDTGATWIDGKTIYKKSYSVTISSNTQTVNLGISDMYEVVKLEAIWHAGGTLVSGVPTTFCIPGDSTGQNTISIVAVNGSSVNVYSQARNGTKGVMTVYYTKSS